MNCLIVGSSAGLGRALAEKLAARGHALFLVASDERDLKAQAADLHLRHGVRIGYAAIHLSPTEKWLPRLVETAEAFGELQGLFFPIGFSVEGDRGFLEEEKARELLEVNFLGITAIVSHFLPALRQRGHGFIVGIGSIAAIRGRKANFIYAAAKRALLSYFESLQHLAARTGIKVYFYEMGYLSTQQSFGRRLLFPVCSPERAAAMICDKLDRRPAIRYYPGFWGWIACVLRSLPSFVFNRLEF